LLIAAWNTRDKIRNAESLAYAKEVIGPIKFFSKLFANIITEGPRVADAAVNDLIIIYISLMSNLCAD